MAHEVNDKNFEELVVNNKSLVLVDFWAPWCGPCKQITPIIEQIANDLSDKIKVYKCNIDENPEAPSKYQVRGIPTLMIFKKGKLVDTKVGSLPKSAILEWISNHI